MEVAAESAILNPSTFFPRSSPSFLPASHPQIRLPTKNFPSNLLISSRIPTNCIVPYARNDLFSSRFQQNQGLVCRFQQSEVHGVEDSITSLKLGFFVIRRIIALAATVIGVLVFGCRRVFAVEGVVDSGYGVIGQSILLLKSYWLKLSQVLWVSKRKVWFWLLFWVSLHFFLWLKLHLPLFGLGRSSAMVLAVMPKRRRFGVKFKKKKILCFPFLPQSLIQP